MSRNAAHRIDHDHGSALALTGTLRDVEQLNARLLEISKVGHLVAPATSCGMLPEGVAIAISLVAIDVENETYPVRGSGGDDEDDQRQDSGGGKRGLTKVALDRIAAAAGMSWDTKESGRTDDRSDPHYCSYLAVGYYRQFDGQTIKISREREVDLRDGSPQVIAMKAKGARAAEKAKRNGWRSPDPMRQIQEARLNIQSLAETKAYNRAIRAALGIRTAYAPHELEKPFICAKVAWTGQTNDPELRREFARMQAAAMLGGARALYGAAPAPASGPKTIDMVDDRDDEDDDDDGDGISSAPVRPTTAKAAAPPASPPPPPARPAAPPTAAAANDDDLRIPFGRDKGKRIAELDDTALLWLEDYFTDAVNDSDKARWKDGNQRFLVAIARELELRNSNHNPGFDPGML